MGSVGVGSVELERGIVLGEDGVVQKVGPHKVVQRDDEAGVVRLEVPDVGLVRTAQHLLCVRRQLSVVVLLVSNELSPVN